jgi:hypothetical protein
MKRMLSLLGVAGLTALVGCSGGGNNGSDGGTDGGFQLDPPDIQVSGTASVHPAAKVWLADAGLPQPVLTGLAIQFEDPLKAGLNDPDAGFATAVVSAAGEFSAPVVPTSEITVGLSGAFRDPGGITIIPSSTVIWDVNFAQRRPRADLADVSVLALPEAFHDALTNAVGPTNISGLTGAQHTTLRGAGFILGQVVNGDGDPVAGAQVTTNPVSLQNRVFYFSPTYGTPGPSQTSTNGLFLLVHDGGDPVQLKLQVSTTGYGERGMVAAKGVGQMLQWKAGSPADPYP